MDVVNSDLCIGCATCAGTCPNYAISMKVDSKRGVYHPKINENKCTDCGFCSSVCPGIYTYSRAAPLTNPRNIGDLLVGDYIRFYVGHATDSYVRGNSSSGGLVTQLLIYALEKGAIDGALVTKMSKTNPLRPLPFIARTKEEIISAAKTKYCPVPLNIALEEIRSNSGRFALVGLPCHIQGARKAELMDSRLRERIVLHFGLICHHTPTFLATKYLLSRLGISKDNISKIEYRGNCRPAKMSITLTNGHMRYVDLYSKFYWGGPFSNFFTQTRCTLCSDKMCQFADITFGDAWLPEFSKEKQYESMVISRTKIGENFLQNANHEGFVHLLTQISIDNVIESQSLLLARRRYDARIRFVQQQRGKNVYPIPKNISKIKFSDYLTAAMIPLKLYISQNQNLWFLMDLYSILDNMLINT
jgi:coenzyme F420 hydrogenase subunit beta